MRNTEYKGPFLFLPRGFSWKAPIYQSMMCTLWCSVMCNHVIWPQPARATGSTKIAKPGPSCGDTHPLVLHTCATIRSQSQLWGVRYLVAKFRGWAVRYAGPGLSFLVLMLQDIHKTLVARAFRKQKPFDTSLHSIWLLHFWILVLYTRLLG
ncbi:hypothetical protein V8C37DRAFT_77334 [Trichoderma ceciliae]